MAERVTFPSVSGETLAGLLDLPVGAAVIATVSAPYDSSHLAPGQARRAARIISAWADQHLVE